MVGIFVDLWVPFGVGTGFVGSGFDWGGALISGTLFGASWVRSLRGKHAGACGPGRGGVTEQLRRARRASQRGPVPTDPETRQQAYQLAVRTLERITRGRVFALLACAMVGFAAITRPPGTGSPSRFVPACSDTHFGGRGGSAAASRTCAPAVTARAELGRPTSRPIDLQRLALFDHLLQTHPQHAQPDGAQCKIPPSSS